MKSFIRMPKGIKDVVILVGALAVLAVGVWWFWFREADTALAETVYLSTEMQRTTIMDSISGSGNLVSNDTADIRTAVSGKIAEIYVQNGDYVVKDQPMYRLTNDTLVTALQQAQVDMATAKNTYDRMIMQNGNSSGQLRDAQLKVEQRQNALDAQITNRGNLQVYATENGHITDVLPKVGDDISNGGTIFSFYSDVKEDTVEYQVKLQQAKATLESRLKDYEKLTVKADYAGQVTDLSVKAGDTVLANELLMNILEPDRLEKTTDSDTRLRIEQAQLTASNREKDVQNLQVVAPATGLISDLKLLPGDSVATSTTLATISDNRQIIVKVDVTQAYINGIRRGNKAEVSIANSARVYQGIVTDVAPQGNLNPSNSLVTYPVEITIDNDGTLLAGMSAIVTISSSDSTFQTASSLRGTLANDVTKVVNPKVSGDIVELRAQNGDWVLEGQVIAILSNDSVILAYDQAQQDLRKLFWDEFRAPGLAVVQTLSVKDGDYVAKDQVLLTLQSDAVEAAYLQAKLDYEKLLNRESGNSDIRSKVSGKLEALHVQKGDKVQAGQLLAELSSSDLLYQEQRALTDLEQAKAELQALLINTSAGELELARMRYEQASLTVDNAQKRVDDLIIKALISGSITEKISITVGDELEALKQLAVIYDYSAYKLEISVDELEIPKFTIGSMATVTVDAFPGQRFPAQVFEISREGNVSQGGSGSTFPVKVVFTTDQPLRAGMTATAEVVMQRSDDTFVVSKSAITALQSAEGPTTYRVFLLVNEDELQTVDIEVGIITNTMAEITKGVKEGDKVVTASVNTLTGDMTVMGRGMGSSASPMGMGGFGPMSGGNVMIMPGGAVSTGGAVRVR